MLFVFDLFAVVLLCLRLVWFGLISCVWLVCLAGLFLVCFVGVICLF